MAGRDTAVPIITTVSIRIVGAGILYIIGRWLIGLAVSLVSRVLTARSFDATLQSYVVNISAAVLYIVLVVAILGWGGDDKLCRPTGRRRPGHRRGQKNFFFFFLNGVDPLAAIGRLKVTLAAIPNVVAAPAPDVEILDFIGALLAVRPYCHTDHYWQVYFDTNNLIAAIRHRRLSGALCGSGTPRRAQS